MCVLRAFPVAVIVALSVTACSKSGTPTPNSGTGTTASSPAGTAAAPPAAATAPPPVTPAPPPGAADPPPTSALIKPVPAQLPNVVARINGETVTKGELEKQLTVLERQNGGPVPAAERDRIVRGLLDQMIGFKLLLQESQSRKVAVTDPEVDARI